MDEVYGVIICVFTYFVKSCAISRVSQVSYFYLSKLPIDKINVRLIKFALIFTPPDVQ
jgi:hypothetical protein